MSGERNWLREWWFVWLPLGLLALIAAGYGAYRAILRRRLNERLQAFADAGYPTTLEELDEWYEEPPPGENAADIYLEAFRHLVDPTEEQEAKLPWVGDAEWPSPGKPLPPEMRSAIEAHVEANRETIQLLREGASRERCRYPIDLQEGIMAELPPLGNMRASTSLLSLATCLNAREGRADAAAKTLEAAFALADSFAQIPNMICQLVRMAAQNIALDGLEHALNDAAVPDCHLVRLQYLLGEAASRTQALERGLVGETLAMFYAAWAMRTKNAADLMETDAVYYLGVMGQYLGAQQEPFPRRIEICRRVESRVEKAFDHRFWRLIHVFSAATLPTGVQYMVLREAETTARLRLGLVALAVERFRLDNRRLPANLSALVPTYIDEVPADPFDEQPVRYRVESPGYLLYSIGRNEADDGGTETGDEETGDIVFRVSR